MFFQILLMCVDVFKCGFCREIIALFPSQPALGENTKSGAEDGIL